MKVFMSWSGARSKAVAELMSEWIRCVLQATRPWVSTRDLDRGAVWFSEINDQLRDTTAGIICLTQENKDRPWILFEAGALAKGLSTSRVCTFLVDLETKDIQDPLAQFNHTRCEKESVLRLVQSLNGQLGEHALDPRILVEVFNTYWPTFEANFRQAVENNPATTVAPPRADSDILAEILDNTRVLQHRIQRLERRSNENEKLSMTSNHDSDQAVAFARHCLAENWPLGSIISELADFGYDFSSAEKVVTIAEDLNRSRNTAAR